MNPEGHEAGSGVRGLASQLAGSIRLGPPPPRQRPSACESDSDNGSGDDMNPPGEEKRSSFTLPPDAIPGARGINVAKELRIHQKIKESSSSSDGSKTNFKFHVDSIRHKKPRRTVEGDPDFVQSLARQSRRVSESQEEQHKEKGMSELERSFKKKFSRSVPT